MLNLVVEIGSLNTKIGYSSQSYPRMSTESVLIEADPHRHLEDDQLFTDHVQRHFAYNLDVSRKDVTVQDIFQRVWKDEEKKIGLVNCTVRKEQYCKFLGEIIAQTRDINSTECGVLLVEPSNLKPHEVEPMRNTICKYLFEELNLQSVYFLKNSVSNIFGQGVTTGIVVDSGEHFTTVSRVHDGYQDAMTSFDFGGNLINHQIQTLLNKNNKLNSLNFMQYEGPAQLKTLLRARDYRDIKEQMFKDSADIESQRVVEVELPDNQTIKIDKEEICEPFTRLANYKQQNQSFIFPSNYQGLPQTIVELMADSQEKLKNSLSKRIMFSGGNFLYRDLLDRTKSQVAKSAELRQLDQPDFLKNKFKLLSGWIGGSIVSSLPSFAPYWVTGKEWQENGISVVMKKCP